MFKISPGQYEVYHSSGLNNFFLFSDWKSITIGSGGDGPAIRLDQDLHDGRTSQCETFHSPILVHEGQKHIDDAFKAKNFEVFIL